MILRVKLDCTIQTLILTATIASILSQNPVFLYLRDRIFFAQQMAKIYMYANEFNLDPTSPERVLGQGSLPLDANGSL